MVKYMLICVMAVVVTAPLILADAPAKPAADNAKPADEKSSAVPWFERALAAAAEMQDDSARFALLVRIAEIQTRAGLISDAAATLNKVTDPWKKIGALNELVTKAAQMKKHDDAMNIAATIEDPFTRAFCFLSIARIDKDAKAFQAALTAGENIASAEGRLQLIGSVACEMVQAGMLNEALAALSTVKEQDKRDSLTCGMILYMTKPEEALPIARQITDPSARADALRSIARTPGNEANMEALLREAFDVAQKITDPERRKGTVAYIASEEASKGLVDAVKDACQANGFEPDESASLLARAYIAARKLDDARTAILSIKGNKARLEMLSDLVSAQMDAKDIVGALASIRDALEAAKKEKMSVDQILHLTLLMASEQVRSGDKKAAAETLTLAVSLAETDPEDNRFSLYRVADYQCEMGLYDDAAKTARKIREPWLAMMKTTEIIVKQAGAGDRDGARRIATDLIAYIKASMPDDKKSSAFEHLACEQTRAGMLDEAFALLKEITEDASRGMVYAHIASGEATLGEHDNAVKNFAQAVKLLTGKPGNGLIETAAMQSNAGFKEDAAKTYLLAKDAAKKDADPAAAARALYDIGYRQLAVNKKDARQTFADAAQISMKIEDSVAKGKSLSRIGIIQANNDFLPDASSTFAALADVCKAAKSNPLFDRGGEYDAFRPNTDCIECAVSHGMVEEARVIASSMNSIFERAVAFQAIANALAKKGGDALEKSLELVKDQPPEVRAAYYARVASLLSNK